MFASKDDIQKTKYALESLIQAMKWDEKVFGESFFDLSHNSTLQ